MSWNGLRRLPETLFRGAPRLGLLRLSHNALTALPETLLAGLDRLEELDLAGNRLDSVAPALFSGLAALRRLRLDDNRIKMLPHGTPTTSARQLRNSKHTYFKSFLEDFKF